MGIDYFDYDPPETYDNDGYDPRDDDWEREREEQEAYERWCKLPKCKNCGRPLNDQFYRRQPKSGGMLDAPGLCDICYNNWLDGLIFFDVFFLG